MKEFIEKLIERLEEISVSRDNDGVINGCNMGICEDDDCLKCLKKKVISIVNELAEEYKTIDVAELVEKFGQEKVQSNDGWIPCSERLPEVEKEVLIFADDNAMFVGRLMNGGFSVHDGDGWIDLKFILAWRSLPEPYKGE